MVHNSFYFGFLSFYTLSSLIVINSKIDCVNAFPSNSNQSFEESVQASAGNLLLTFEPGEVPEGFQEVQMKSQTSESMNKRNLTQTYSICQDGSGGLCVPTGDCPVALTTPIPKDQNVKSHDTSVCASDYECCYGYPDYERSCQIRGGSCLRTSECGYSPKFRIDAECDIHKDEICCILT